MKSLVVIAESDDKYAALDEVLATSSFFEHLKKKWEESNISKEEFLIAIKPNIMMAYQKSQPHTATDTQLVEYLIQRMGEEGYSRIAVVESQNILTDWFPGRTVSSVAQACGYTGNGYELINLTREAEPFHYGGYLGTDAVGKTWKNAHFRISFAKNKTHIACWYTLTMKNLFGTLPTQSKMRVYHKSMGWEKATLDVLRSFPPDFALIDAFWSSHGFNGCAIETPLYTRTIIGGTDCMAVDWVGAEKMGVDPAENPLMELAMREWRIPEFSTWGNTDPYPHWKNTSVKVGNIFNALDCFGMISFFYRLMYCKLMDPQFK
jgi:uncharacterized protein (DUF362 family)